MLSVVLHFIVILSVMFLFEIPLVVMVIRHQK